MNIPLNSIYPTSDGIIARQTVAGDAHAFGLTLHLKRDLSCDIVIPLIQYEQTASDLRATLESRYLYADRFIQVLERQGHYGPEGIVHPRVIDLTMLLFILMDLTRKYGDILHMADVRREYYCKARILHGWRRIPFIDVPQVLERFAKHGVPILPNDEITVPTGEEPESFLYLGDGDADARSIDGHLGE